MHTGPGWAVQSLTESMRLFFELGISIEAFFSDVLGMISSCDLSVPL